MDQVLKVVEMVIEKIISEYIVIDDMQLGFMPGCGTTDSIFIVRQLQEKFGTCILLSFILKRLLITT